MDKYDGQALSQISLLSFNFFVILTSRKIYLCFSCFSFFQGAMDKN